MQEVDADYTRISIETAERVGGQLNTSLIAQGFSIGFRLQGSVPLNVHIRGVSDVDLLTLDLSFLTYMSAGRKHQLGQYTNPTSLTSVGVLGALRQAAERTLASAYPAATVDTSGAKAIKISGGSLARPVDVVPSHWHDTVEYQASGLEYDRGVKILDKRLGHELSNLPFLHIKRISDRCGLAAGALRKSIRLCKNVKADAEKEGQQIALPSFDIAATMYHADLPALQMGAVYELAILAETQRHLDMLARSQEYARTLRVPDGSRPIFDTTEKLQGLVRLSIEMDDLVREVGKEQSSALAHFAEPSLSDSRTAIASSYVI